MTGVRAVTGGASGIGRAAALHLAGAGAAVAMLDVDEDGAASLAAEIRARGGTALALGLDVRDADAVAEAFSRIDRELGSPAALVTCAGRTMGAGALEMSPADWQGILDINLTGTFLCCQQAARRMAQAGGGAIVTVASVTGLAGTTTRAAYAASKGGVVALTRALAVELGPRGIRVNCVAPGAIETPLVAAHHSGAGAPIRERYLSRTPLGRYGSAEEIAKVVAFLVSPAAAYVHGEVLAVDGGFLATGMMFRA